MLYENDGISNEKEQNEGIGDILDDRFRDFQKNAFDNMFFDNERQGNNEKNDSQKGNIDNSDSDKMRNQGENLTNPQAGFGEQSYEMGGTEAQAMAEGGSEVAAAAAEGGAETAAEGASALGGPALMIAVKLATTAKALKSELNSVGEKQTLDSEYGLNKTLMGIVIILFFVVIYVIFYVGTLIQWITPGSVEKYREAQFPTSEEVKIDFLKDEFPTVKAVLVDYNGLEEYDREQLNKNALDIYRKLIDASIKDIFTNFSNMMIDKYDLSFIEKFMLGELKHDTEKTIEEFLKQPYPYCRKPSHGSPFYTIEQFLNGEIPSYSEGSQSYLNDDINYAEILSVFGMKEDFQFGADANTLENFARLLCGDRAKQLLYEFKAEIVYITEEVEREEEVEVEKNGKKEKVKNTVIDVVKTGYYYTFKVMPYGLRELYQIAEIDITAPDITFEKFTNAEMFDRKEMYLRTFARDALKTIGPAYDELREARSFAYHQGVMTGRSPYYYIEDADNYLEFEEMLPEWDKKKKPNKPQKIEYKDGAVILPMPTYINQGDYPEIKRGNSTTTVKSSGCIDACYVMIANYYGIDISMEETAANSTYYNGNDFNGAAFLADNGLSYGGTGSFDVDTVRSHISNGNPVMIRIKGKWEYGGKTYHRSSNTHFLVIMGYDDTGFYVYDPGSRNNTTGGPIPYDAFSYVNHKLIRTPGA